MRSKEQKQMNKRRALLLTATLFLGGFSLMASVPTFAQGRYANRYSKRDVSGIISRMETSSNAFRRDFDRAMDNSNLNGTGQEERFNNIVRDFENSVDRLRREFDRNAGWWETRGQVENMIREARPVNSMMTSLAFRRNIERQWNQLRNDINTVADTYDLPGLNGGGWTGSSGGEGGDGQTSRPPSWASGTFYSTDGSNIMMTINPNGRVTVVNAGNTYYGTFYRNRINLNNDTSDISRQGDGIRTYNRNTGQYTTYSRQGWGGGGGSNTSRPPSWAQGSWMAVNSPDSILMTIDSNGTITLNNNGQTYYGTYYSDTINLNGDISTVTRNGNRLRTYNQRTGQTTDYRRQ
jgi:hypothetical protein